MNKLEILEKLVSFNTVKDKENDKIINYIEQYLKTYDFEIEYVLDCNRKKCLVATIGVNPILGLMGHMDTVEVGDDWLGDPFKLTEKDGNLFGLGTCDMKGGIAAILVAVSQIDFSKLKRGLMLVFTTDEEYRFSGIKAIIDSKINLPPYVIVAEPTNLYPVVSTKGAIAYEIIFKGKSCHSSTPALGHNAILESVDFINKLVLFANKIAIEKNNLFDVPNTTMNLGIIEGGKMVNVVPDKCSIKFELRTIKREHNTLIDSTVMNMLKNCKCSVKKLIDIAPMENKDKDFIEHIEMLSQKSIGLSYLTEASYLGDSNNIIFGPGPITAHQSNEFISFDSYEKTIDIYVKIIESKCLK